MTDRQPYVSIDSPCEFPYHLLSDEYKNTYHCVKRISQASDGLIYSVMLSIMGLACQDLIEIQVHEQLRIKPMLYIIVSSPSGSGKTFVFNMLTSSIRLIQESLDRDDAEALRTFDGEMKIWEIQIKAAEKGLAKAIRDNMNIDHYKETIRQLHQTKPLQPSARQLILNDVTNAAIMQQLGNGNPSFAIMSDEAGGLFKKDFLKETSNINTLWSGGGISMRRGSGSGVTVNDISLSIMLMVQPKLFRKFLAENGDIVRDSGFLARALICEPQSTQGSRVDLDEVLLNDDDLTWFHSRVTSLIKQGIERRYKGRKHHIVTLSSEALEFWKKNRFKFEPYMAEGKPLEQYHDYCSKFMEHATRLAAVIEVFSNGYETEISLASMEAGYCIANWYFDHFIEIMSGNNGNSGVTDAEILDNWLKENVLLKGNVAIEKNKIRQYGPNRLRDNIRLNAILSQLESEGRVKLYKKKNTYMVSYVEAEIFHQIGKSDIVASGYRPYEFAPYGSKRDSAFGFIIHK